MSYAATLQRVGAETDPEHSAVMFLTQLAGARARRFFRARGRAWPCRASFPGPRRRWPKRARQEQVCRVPPPDPRRARAGGGDGRRGEMAAFVHAREAAAAQGARPVEMANSKPGLKRSWSERSAHTDLVRQVAPAAVRAPAARKLACAACTTNRNSVLTPPLFARGSRAAGPLGLGRESTDARADGWLDRGVADPEEGPAQDSERPGATP